MLESTLSTYGENYNLYKNLDAFLRSCTERLKVLSKKALYFKSFFAYSLAFPSTEKRGLFPPEQTS